ncbi:MAG TPA: Fe-S cluster assembly protein SufD [Actinomycetota bacterium]
MKVTREIAFEDAIIEWLTTRGGYTKGIPAHYDPAVALDTAELFTFIGSTQAEEWEELVRRNGGDPDVAQRRFVDRLAKQIDERGTIDVLRHGVEDIGVEIRLAYFRPASGLNPELQRRYDADRLTVTRQLHYAPEHANALDLALFVNGLPVATAELKNPLTHQTVEHAMAQYRTDRDPRDALLGRRAIVHFAVDPDLVMMTTRLEGAATRFLPFNRGSDPGATACGAGNAPNPDGYATSYLWERVWERHAWLDVLNRFIHVEQAAPGRKSKAALRGSTLIFPRFHQWDAVRRLEAHARERGSGRNYLVQHSAGSGKSNTIAWLAHRLASLHDAADQKVFDKVVVVTDRRVLDRQLQDTVYQFEHAHGVVKKVEESSKELAEALRSAEAKIVVTTLQKFPFIVEEVANLPERRYAVIVDEAHSSQTGETAQEMKKALGGVHVDTGEEGEIDPQDAVEALVEASAKARGPHANLSMFAFTATPKGKTLELFGEPPDEDGRMRPFHLYSMRQAIEEGFIVDVLAHYTTYDTYFRLARAGEEDPEVSVREASKAIARYVTLHPSVVAQKAAVVVEHFRRSTRDRIGGKAKAMVVCGSRLSAVRFRRAIDAYAREHGYGDVKTLVAFSGTVTDGGIEYTEPNMNGFPERQTAERFGSDGYRILVVAEKFQTGFDQPLLHTMFVDKKLEWVNAVQTLSRLNRIHPLKEDTFVLDFVNDAEQIRRAFGPYYDVSVAVPTDPNELYDAWREVDRFGVVRPEDVEAFARAFFRPGDGAQSRLYALLDAARDRFTDLDETDQEELRTWLKRFVSRYGFISQVLPMADTAMEKRYAYCRLLERRLPSEPSGSMDLGDQVQMTHLHLKEAGQHDLSLAKGGGLLHAFGEGGPGGYEDLLAPLSELIDRLNERFGGDLSEADRLHLEGIGADMVANPEVQQQAAANTAENFGIEFDRRFTDAVAARMSQAEELTIRILDTPEFREEIMRGLMPRVYERARVAYQKACPIGELLARKEDKHLEFKSTLRWDLEKAEKTRLVETATIKTVAALLNSEFGGTLVIGVADDGSIVGLDHDYMTLHREGRDDADRFVLHLNQLVENAVGLAAAANVTTSIHHVDGHDLCRVHVEPSGHPVEAEVTVADERGQHGTKRQFYAAGTTGRGPSRTRRSGSATSRSGGDARKRRARGPESESDHPDRICLMSERAAKTGFDEEALAALPRSASFVDSLRKQAFEEFLTLPVPSQETEEWRYTDVSEFTFDLAPFAEGGRAENLDEVPGEILEAAGVVGDRAGLQIQRNSEVMVTNLAPELVAKGVVFCDLDRAILEHPDLVERSMQGLVPSDRSKFTALHTAFRSGGTFLFVPEGVEIEVPIQTLTWLDADEAAVFPRTLLVAEEGSEVTFIDRYASPDLGRALSDAVVELYAGPNSRVRYVVIQEWGTGVTHLSVQRARIDEGARLKTLGVAFGGSLARAEIESELAGDGGSSEMLGLYFGDADQHIDHRSIQDHVGSRTSSDLLYKGAMKGRSNAIYTGTVIIRKGAHLCDAYQTNRNILLSETARAHSVPNLEILTNDPTRCGHAASVGPVGEDELFYLMSRGISREEAERLILFGFFQEVLDRVDLEEIREGLERTIEAELAGDGRS